MAPAVRPTRVQRTPENYVPLAQKKPVTQQPQQQPQTNVVDRTLRQNNLADLQLRGAMEKLRLNKMEIQKQQAQKPEPPPDSAVDGHYLGADGKTYPPNTPLGDIPAVQLPPGELAPGVQPNNETIIYTNGILSDTEAQKASLEAIARQTGSRVIGVRNATDGFVGDAVQVFNDRVDRVTNPAVDTLADTVYNEISNGRPVHLMAHSQGGIVTSRALTDVKNRLVAEDGLTIAQAEARMSGIRVETFGAAARSYTDGPQYVHYVRKNDAVPQALGLGSNNYSDSPYAGRGAVVHEFEGKGEPIFNIPHGFDDFYIKDRVPFEQARQGNFKPQDEFGILDIPKNLAIDARNAIVEEVTPILHTIEGAVETVRTIGDKAVEAWNFTKDKAVQAWNFTKDKAVQAWDFTKDKATQAWNFTTEKANQAWNFTKEKANEFGNFASEKFNQAKTAVEAGWKSFTSSLPWN